MKNASLCHRASMDRAALSPLLRSFERHLRAENRSEHTIASYLDSLRQAEAFLAGRGRTLVDARREDLEAFLSGGVAPAPGAGDRRHPLPAAAGPVPVA
jgi:Phage integrase, N-terminal SAM-like domain